MIGLERTLAGLKAKGEGALMPFFVAGDPEPALSLELMRASLDAGADVLEVGFAFSDPPADGPVIQAADQRALKAGMTPRRSFELLEALRKNTAAPFALLVYYNLVLRFGVERFFARAQEVGVEAILIADLPIEEGAAALAAAERHRVAPIFIASELTRPERLRTILAAAKGYVYVVAHVGVTGARTEIAPGLAAALASLRRATTLPLLAGFGISSPEQVRAVLAAGADGAIVGSALIREIESGLGDRGALPAVIAERVTALKRATRRE